MSETNRDGPYLRCEAGGIEIRVWLPELTADYTDDDPTDEMIEKANMLVKRHVDDNNRVLQPEGSVRMWVWNDGELEWEING